MTGWVDDINRATMDNETFRTVIFLQKRRLSVTLS